MILRFLVTRTYYDLYSPFPPSLSYRNLYHILVLFSVEKGNVTTWKLGNQHLNLRKSSERNQIVIYRNLTGYNWDICYKCD